jgi:hypothetical protein
MNISVIDPSAGASPVNPKTKVKKGSKRKATQPADISEEGRAEGESSNSPSPGDDLAASGENSTSPEQTDYIPGTRFKRSQVEFRKAQLRVEELTTANADLAAANADLELRLRAAQRIRKKNPLPPLESDIEDAEADSESDVSGSFDNDVNPHNGEGDDGHRQPGGQGKTPFTPSSSEALAVGGNTVIHLDTQVMKPLATAEFTTAEAVAFTRQLESIHRSGKWTSETLARWTSTASQKMITCDLVNRKAVKKSSPMEWLTWPPERVISKFKEVYSAHRDVRYVTPEDFWLTKAKSFKPEAVRPGDAAGPTHSLRVHMLQPLMQALADHLEPPQEILVAVVDELVRSFTAPTNEHKTKAGNIRLKDRLYSAVASARKASVAPVTVFDFTIMMGEEMGEVEQVHQTSVSMGLTGPKDRQQPKGSGGQQPSGGSVAGSSQEVRKCNGCGGEKHLAKDCKLKEHPDFNKEGPWEASEAYKALKLRFPNTRDPSGSITSSGSMGHSSRNP